MNKLLSLFLTFAKIGAFTFGGGYAMIPLIQKEAVENKKWISDEDVLEIIAIAESTPGPIAINSATFVGYRVAGFWGAACATFGVVLPSFLIIFVLAGVLRQFKDLPAVQYAFWGIRAGVLALIVKALIGMFKKCKKDIPSYCIMVGVFVAVAVCDLEVLPVLIAAAVVGLCVSQVKRRMAK